MQRERCWLTHRHRAYWFLCPLCNKPVIWKKSDLDEWTPCDELPVLYVEVPKGKLKLFKKRELIEGCELYEPKAHRDIKPQYALMPHYYTCTVLKRERAEWAGNNNLWLCKAP